MPKKSKYVKDVSDFKAMTDRELRDYIRGGSKVLRSKVNRLAKSPYAEYSPTLAKYKDLTKGDKRVFSHGFGTQGKSYSDLRRMANYINTMLGNVDTPGKLANFGKSIDRIDALFEQRKFFGAENEWRNLIYNNMDAVKDYVSKNVDTWISYVGSDGVDDVFNVNEYDNEEEQYLDLFKTIILEYRHTDMKIAGKRLATERLNQGVPPTKGIAPTKGIRFKGKFKK